MARKAIAHLARLGAVVHFRRYLKSSVLLLTAAVAGLAALVCFPTDSPVAPRGGLQNISVDTPVVPSTVSFWLTDVRARNEIVVAAQVVTTTPQTAHSTLSIVVPGATWGGLSRCSPQPSHCVPFGSAKDFRVGLTRWTKFVIGQQTFYREFARVLVPHAGYNTSSNDEYISATLPNAEVYLQSKRAGYVRQDVPRNLTLWIPHADRYTWTSGSLPAVSGPYATWEFTTPPGSALVANGVSLPVQDADSKLLFLAGALLGVAGGAIVGAIQEAVKQDQSVDG